jgi:homoserine dehydrogenase
MKRVRLGLMGCGNVGTAFCRLLGEKREQFAKRDQLAFELAAIAVKHPEKKRDACVPTDLIVEGWQRVTERSDLDVVVELIGGAGDARDAVFDALGRGHHTVTANKVIMAADGAALTELAADRKCGICFEATVGSGTPIIGPIANALNANRFDSIIGIMNGTTNYILSKMTEEGASFDDALKDAVAAGFSEADPSFDLQGKDAAQKLSILAALAYGVAVPPEEILTEGIEHITADDIKAVAVFGYVIKLLSIAKRTPHGVELRVHPALVNSRHPLAAVRGELNAFYLSGDVSGEVMFYGKGAGPIPTAGAVLSDVVRLANFEKNTWLSRRWNYDNLEHVPTGDIETGYHLIFPVLDKPGIIGRITSTLGSYNINIESAHAHLPEPRNGYGVVQILSSNARERDIRAAIAAVSELPLLCGKARFFRIAVPAK